MAATGVTLEDIGEPLSSTTFVVVDLETTGASPASCEITEIGAVKMRGGEVIGEFQTLVDPGAPIPPMIIALTGITNAMVMAAPRIREVLPAFLEFLGDAVLVAHNARFDVGFLRAACKAHGYAWPAVEVVDTLTLARRVVSKDEAPNRKLGTLARVFGTQVTPNHRALEDARATGEILHGMLERLAAFGITHREDLASLKSPVPPEVRAKSTLADRVPSKPGVYVFRGPDGERLYVGTSKNLRSRVKSYFTKAETRGRIRDMVSLAVSVDTMVCPTALEASVLEVRLIDQWRPRYNRRSAHPERTPWIKLTDEAYPRLVVSRSSASDGTHWGPMRSMSDAQLAIEALQQSLGVRSCRTRLPRQPKPHATACILHDLGACSAPCIKGVDSGYAQTHAQVQQVLNGDVSPVVNALADHVAEFALTEEFERAADLRDRISAVVDGSMRTARLASLAACSIVAVRRVDDGWDVVSVVGGALSGTRRVKSGVWAAADDLRSAQHTLELHSPLVEEQELILAWLEKPGTRLLYVDGTWSSPVAGAGRHRGWVAARRGDREATGQRRGR
ncbi:DEDD exonuclease domain-containing protein [Demequina globuliformis]|uniref:DEDD exonuclease domain-containing protein n=1 Tax=Demequina globuliformis TaxID=676202 RepID=UPI000785B3B1|nr:DEDD exonuclease domain-containing protein [Demequina globuliformis]